MPNHWHLVLYPKRPGDLPDFFRWVCAAHVRSWRNRWLQIGAAHETLNLAGRRVLVKRRGDGVVVLEYQKRQLIYQELGSRPVAAKPKRTVVNNRRWNPAATHP